METAFKYNAVLTTQFPQSSPRGTAVYALASPIVTVRGPIQDLPAGPDSFRNDGLDRVALESPKRDRFGGRPVDRP